MSKAQNGYFLDDAMISGQIGELMEDLEIYWTKV